MESLTERNPNKRRREEQERSEEEKPQTREREVQNILLGENPKQ